MKIQNQSKSYENVIPLIAIVGPTAVGKSLLSMEISNHLNIEIINADSRQVYKGMEIGTASPTPNDQVRIPHHGYQILNPDQPYNLSDFLDFARSLIIEINERNNIPLLIGGTGQYIWALLDGWTVPKVPPDNEFRAEAEALVVKDGPGKLLLNLEKIDPLTAKTIDRNNIRRVIRALEVYHTTGTPMSQLKRREQTPYKKTIIGVTTETREILHKKIDNRIEKMLDSGWLDEANHLLDKGYKFNLPSFSSMGYKELFAVLRNEIELGDAILKIQKLHHKLARMQYTWFKSDNSEISWITVNGNELVDTLDLLHFK